MDPCDAWIAHQEKTRTKTMSDADVLVVRMGNKTGESFRVRSVGSAIEKTGHVRDHIVDGAVLPEWTSVFVLTGRTIREEKKFRFFKLIPSSDESALEHGEFFVRGRFRITETINNARQAREAWAQTRDRPS